MPGNPPVRFGGRGDRTQSVLPTPIITNPSGALDGLGNPSYRKTSLNRVLMAPRSGDRNGRCSAGPGRRALSAPGW